MLLMFNWKPEDVLRQQLCFTASRVLEGILETPKVLQHARSQNINAFMGRVSQVDHMRESAVSCSCLKRYKVRNSCYYYGNKKEKRFRYSTTARGIPKVMQIVGPKSMFLFLA